MYHGSAKSVRSLLNACLGLLDGGLGGDGGGGGDDGGSGEVSSADNRGVVDDVVGGVGGDVLLYVHLGDVVDGLVHLGDGVDGGGNGVVDVGGGGVVDGGEGGGLNLNLGGLSGDNGGGGNHRGGVGGVVDEGSGGVADNRGGDGLADGINESVLVDVLGEPLKGDGPQATAGGDEIAEGGGEGTGGEAGGQVGVGGRGGQGRAHHSADNNLINILIISVVYTQFSNITKDAIRSNKSVRLCLKGNVVQYSYI